MGALFVQFSTVKLCYVYVYFCLIFVFFSVGMRCQKCQVVANNTYCEIKPEMLYIKATFK